HKQTTRQGAALRASRPDCPDIVLIDQDLPPRSLVDLYRRCHAFVAPSRGEGFGLAIAEPVPFGLPVVTTACGGQRDFCTEDTCWTVDFRFAPSRSHLGIPGSGWVDPDVD